MADHLPKPCDPLYPLLKVPCLSNTPYDQLDFRSYPQRRGFDYGDLASGHFQGHPLSETASFLQEWLYFGVLWLVLGADKTEYVLYDQDDGREYITTRRLQDDMLARLETNMALLRGGSDKGEAAVRTWLQGAEDCLEVLAYFCRLCCNGSRNSIVWPLSLEIDLSLRILGRSLTSLCLATLGRDQRHESVLFQMYFTGSDLVTARLRGSNWCLSEIALAREQFSSSSLYYVSMLRRPTTKRDHTRCDERKCHAFYTDPKTYRTKHVQDSCTCDHVLPNIQKVVEIILRGGIPLLVVEGSAISPHMSISVEEYTNGIEYVALSHVWADGLGNAQHNSLPLCQWQYLREVLEQLSSQTSKYKTKVFDPEMGLGRSKLEASRFWIDTVCVPLSNVSQRARERAINDMKNVYRHAHQVLVLDAELMATDHTEMLESFMRMSLSGWMRRLWTLHEGVLGDRIHVKFKNVIIDVQHGFDEVNGNHYLYKDSLQRILEHGFGSVVADCTRFFWRMREMRMDLFLLSDVDDPSAKQNASWTVEADEMKERMHVMQAFEACRYRTTSRSEDVFICLSNLLGGKVDLWNIPLEQRLPAILEQRSSLPQGIIFVPGPRMKIPGWRWAASNFDSADQNLMTAWIRDPTPGSRSKEGFTIEYPGLILPQKIALNRTNDFAFAAASATGRKQWWRVSLLPADDPSTTPAISFEDRQISSMENDEWHCVLYYPKTVEGILKDIPMAGVLISTYTTDRQTLLDKNLPVRCRFERLAIVQLTGDDGDLLNLLRREDLDIKLCVDGSAGRVRRQWTVD